MIHFSCPQCGATLNTANDTIGRLIRCPRCNNRIEVPRTQSELIPGIMAVAEESPLPVPAGADDLEVASLPALYSDLERPSSKIGPFMVAFCLVACIAATLVIILAIAARQRENQLAQGASPKKPLLEAPIPVPEPPPHAVPPADDQQPAIKEAPEGLPAFKEPAERGPEQQPGEPKAREEARPQPPPEPKPPAQPDRNLPKIEKENKETDALVASLRRRLKSLLEADRIEACEGLRKLGAPAKAASQDLCQAMLDRNAKIGRAAAEALEQVNPEIQRVVMTLFVDKDHLNRLEALRKIKEMKEEGQPATPMVVHHLDAIELKLKFSLAQRSPGSNARGLPSPSAAVSPDLVAEAVACFEALVEVSKDNPPALVPVLLKCTKSRDATIRRIAVESLPEMQNIGNRDIVIVRTLVSLLRTDSDDGVKQAAATALGGFGKGSKVAENALRDAKADPCAAVREAATKAYEQVREK
jgi:DNA-directed RNA polymerase subunit RPC12/RpoP